MSIFSDLSSYKFYANVFLGCPIISHIYQKKIFFKHREIKIHSKVMLRYWD